jgi:hypothetical protein
VNPETRFGHRLRDNVPREIVTLWWRIENGADTGTPDIYYHAAGDAGWCELKHIHEYPARPTTPLRFKKFTPKQAMTLVKLDGSAAQSRIAVQVSADVYIFDGAAAHDLIDGQCAQWWKDNARAWWRYRLNYTDFAKELAR